LLRLRVDLGSRAGSSHATSVRLDPSRVGQVFVPK
jgi:hypothetical protein